MTPQAVAAGTGHAFDLTEDQQAVRDMVRDFAESEIRPIAAKIDETHEFPAETTRKMGELGLLGMFVPEEYGGAQLDYLSYVIAIEEHIALQWCSAEIASLVCRLRLFMLVVPNCSTTRTAHCGKRSR